MNTIERNHPGYDIRSEHRDNNDQMTAVRYIEVKGRIVCADTVTVSRNEILTSLNEPDKWVLALVKVHPGQGEEIRYLHRPFEAHRDGIDFAVTSVNFNWNKLWASGNERPTTFVRKKLIEVALPLDVINAGVGSGEVDSAWASVDVAFVVGAGRWRRVGRCCLRSWLMIRRRCRISFQRLRLKTWSVSCCLGFLRSW